MDDGGESNIHTQTDKYMLIFTLVNMFFLSDYTEKSHKNGKTLIFLSQYNSQALRQSYIHSGTYNTKFFRQFHAGTKVLCAWIKPGAKR